MSKQKSLSELEAERAACERQLAQLQHKVQQYENRIAYCEKGERRKRTHRLITRGAAVESVAPTVKALTEVEFYAFTEEGIGNTAILLVRGMDGKVHDHAPTHKLLQ